MRKIGWHVWTPTWTQGTPGSPIKNMLKKHCRSKVRHRKQTSSTITVPRKQGQDPWHKSKYLSRHPIIRSRLTHDAIILNNPEDDDQDPIGPSILENIMVHVLPAEFQPTTHQPNSLDGDVVAEEATQVDFVTTTEDEPTNNDKKLKTALAILFPLSSSANLHHLKPLYVTSHIEGYPITKIFVD
ncbi:hypothetical protein PS1_047757 [Malus domestica]